MDTRELARSDLNLLISLQVLLEEKNVSRAAERLFITQPAMSKTLTRGDIDWLRLSDFPLIRQYVPNREHLERQLGSDAVAAIEDHALGYLEIPHLLTALEVLRHTDYFMLAPAYILQNEDATRGVTALPIPRAGVFNINYALVAHNRTARSPMHNWLWEQITCTIRELRIHQPHKMRQRVTAGSSGLSK